MLLQLSIHHETPVYYQYIIIRYTYSFELHNIICEEHDNSYSFFIFFIISL